MTSPQPPRCRQEPIRITDINRAEVMRFLRVCDGSYFGGITHHDHWKLFYGPHCWLPLTSLLDLIARIANLPETEYPYPYTLQGTSGNRFEILQIRREMPAEQLAVALDCDEHAVREYFDKLVRLT